MTRSPALRRASWQDLSEFQSGVISRSQLLGFGLTAAQARADIKTGRWLILHPGVDATFTGPVSTLARTWAAPSSTPGGVPRLLEPKRPCTA